MRTVVIVGRLVLASLSLAGVITQLVIAATGGYSIVNFVSYFTILSNIFASAVFIAGAAQLFSGVEPGRAEVALRGASVVYMLFVGIVFTTLLRAAELGPLLPWVNTVHHYVMPVAVVLDWLLWPPARPIPLRTVLLYLVFPTAYTVFRLVVLC